MLSKSRDPESQLVLSCAGFSAPAGAAPDGLFVLPQVPVAQRGADDAVEGEVAESKTTRGSAEGQAAAAAKCQWQ